jgi:hypothetical protein
MTTDTAGADTSPATRDLVLKMTDELEQTVNTADIFTDVELELDGLKIRAEMLRDLGKGGSVTVP